MPPTRPPYPSEGNMSAEMCLELPRFGCCSIGFGGVLRACVSSL